RPKYRALTLDVCFVGVDVLSRDEIKARFAVWCIRDRRAQFVWIHTGVAKRPWQQRLRKRSILWPACHDFGERGPRFIGASVLERVIEQPELAGPEIWSDCTYSLHRLLDFVAAVERPRRIPQPRPADAEIGIELHQLARCTQRILHATDLVEQLGVILTHIRIAGIDLHRAQVMLLGVGVVKPRPREIAKR